MSNRYTPWKVDNAGIGRWFEREVREMDPYAYSRELVQNAVEAAADTILIDGWTDPDSGLMYTRFTDNGSGFEGSASLRNHLLTLHQTGKREDVNYGIGARLATVTRNPAGVVFATRNAGWEGMVRLQRNGMHVYDAIDADGNDVAADVVVPLDGELDRLGKAPSGTAVILRGTGRSSTWNNDTSNQIQRFLANRYFRWPDGVRVAVHRSLTSGTRGGKAHAQFHSVDPMAAVLAKTSEKSGVVPFHADGLHGVMRWWILAPSSERNKVVAGQNQVIGGVGILVDNEVFAYGKSYAPDFGLVFRTVRERVVVLVDVEGATMDTARGAPVFPGYAKRTPWKRFGRIFAENMPEAIEALNTRVLSSRSFDAEITKFFDPEWRKYLDPTPVKIPGPGTDTTGDKPGRGTRKGTVVGPGPDTPVDDTPRRPRIEPQRAGAGDDTAHVKHTVTVPVVTFVEVEDWDFDEFNIHYVGADNTVYVSHGFGPYRREVVKWTAKTTLSQQVVEAAVQMAYQRELAATVIDVNLQRKTRGDQPGLSAEQIDQMMSPPSLYTKTLGMMSIELSIEENLRGLAVMDAGEDADA